MALKITRLATHWTFDEADTVVAILDELRDALWTAYGDQIADMRCTAMVRTKINDNQMELAFDDIIDFQAQHNTTATGGMATPPFTSDQAEAGNRTFTPVPTNGQRSCQNFDIA